MGKKSRRGRVKTKGDQTPGSTHSTAVVDAVDVPSVSSVSLKVEEGTQPPSPISDPDLSEGVPGGAGHQEQALLQEPSEDAKPSIRGELPMEGEEPAVAEDSEVGMKEKSPVSHNQVLLVENEPPTALTSVQAEEPEPAVPVEVAVGETEDVEGERSEPATDKGLACQEMQGATTVDGAKEHNFGATKETAVEIVGEGEDTTAGEESELPTEPTAGSVVDHEKVAEGPEAAAIAEEPAQRSMAEEIMETRGEDALVPGPVGEDPADESTHQALCESAVEQEAEKAVEEQFSADPVTDLATEVKAKPAVETEGTPALVAEETPAPEPQMGKEDETQGGQVLPSQASPSPDVDETKPLVDDAFQEIEPSPTEEPTVPAMETTPLTVETMPSSSECAEVLLDRESALQEPGPAFTIHPEIPSEADVGAVEEEVEVASAAGLVIVETTLKAALDQDTPVPESEVKELKPQADEDRVVANVGGEAWEGQEEQEQEEVKEVEEEEVEKVEVVEEEQEEVEEEEVEEVEEEQEEVEEEEVEEVEEEQEEVEEEEVEEVEEEQEEEEVEEQEEQEEDSWPGKINGVVYEPRRVSVAERIKSLEMEAAAATAAEAEMAREKVMYRINSTRKSEIPSNVLDVQSGVEKTQNDELLPQAGDGEDGASPVAEVATNGKQSEVSASVELDMVVTPVVDDAPGLKDSIAAPVLSTQEAEQEVNREENKDSVSLDDKITALLDVGPAPDMSMNGAEPVAESCVGDDKAGTTPEEVHTTSESEAVSAEPTPEKGTALVDGERTEVKEQDEVKEQKEAEEQKEVEEQKEAEEQKEVEEQEVQQQNEAEMPAVSSEPSAAVRALETNAEEEEGDEGLEVVGKKIVPKDLPGTGLKRHRKLAIVGVVMAGVAVAGLLFSRRR